jgi:hypothetical protein
MDDTHWFSVDLPEPDAERVLAAATGVTRRERFVRVHRVAMQLGSGDSKAGWHALAAMSGAELAQAGL